MNILCKIGLHDTYWSAYGSWSGHTCKRCRQKWDERNLPKSFKAWRSLENFTRRLK